MEREPREGLAAGPFLVRVDIKVISFEHGEAGGEEDFVAVGEFDRCGVALGVFGAAGEEAAGDEFVDAALVVVLESGGGNVVDWVDWRMGLVVVAAGSGLAEFVVEEVLGVRAPAGVLSLPLDQLAEVDGFVELVGLCSGVADPAVVV